MRATHKYGAEGNVTIAVGKCTGTPATSCHIDAKFNANGTNTLPIAVAVVLVEFARIETAPPPREVMPQ